MDNLITKLNETYKSGRFTLHGRKLYCNAAEVHEKARIMPTQLEQLTKFAKYRVKTNHIAYISKHIASVLLNLHSSYPHLTIYVD